MLIIKACLDKYFIVIISFLIYLIVLSIRSWQGGWEINLDLFPQIRQDFDRKISQVLPSPQAELLSGILLGNKKDLPSDLKLSLRDTGTLHIVVVSGQNLTLLSSLFLGLAGVIRRRSAIILALIAIGLYTMLTGAQIPVLRAACMAVVALLGQILGRQRNGVWALVVTGGAFLLINPAWIGDLSFQLSFLATFGVVVVAAKIQQLKLPLPEFVKIDLAVTLGAQIMVMPVILQNFHQLSVVSVITNLLIGWTVPFVMIAGTFVLLLGSIAGIFVNVLLTYFIYIVKFFADLPFAWIYIGEQAWVVWLGYYLLVWGVVAAVKNSKIKKMD